MLILTALPDSVLLSIFQYLDVKHLSLLSRVCKRFWKLTNDRVLWTNVDLSSFCLNLQRFTKLIHVRFPSSLRSLKVRGYAKVYTPKWKTETVSPSLLGDLSQRCTALETLTFIEVYFSERTTVADLPTSVVSLALVRCNFASYAAWFAETCTLPKLKLLDLSQCPGITQKALNNVFQWKSTLDSLVLQDCHVVVNQTVYTLATSKLNIRFLNLRGTRITNEALTTIALHMLNMKELHVGGVPGNHTLPDQNEAIDNSALQAFYRLVDLQVLVLCNTVVNDDGLKFLYSNKKIHLLDVRDTDVSALGCENFRVHLPRCLVKV